MRAVVNGPIPLPTKIEKFTVNKATFKFKKSREQFEIRTHSRLIDIVQSTPKTIKKNITDLIAELGNEEYSLSVRAANAISMLDDITQDPNMPSYVRVTLWQAVSKLEGIRE